MIHQDQAMSKSRRLSNFLPKATWVENDEEPEKQKVRVSVQNTSKSIFFKVSANFSGSIEKHEIEEKIQEIQDALVSEAEHRIKKFDDIHA